MFTKVIIISYVIGRHLIRVTHEFVVVDDNDEEEEEGVVLLLMMMTVLLYVCLSSNFRVILNTDGRSLAAFFLWVISANVIIISLT